MPLLLATICSRFCNSKYIQNQRLSPWTPIISWGHWEKDLSHVCSWDNLTATASHWLLLPFTSDLRLLLQICICKPSTVVLLNRPLVCHWPRDQWWQVTLHFVPCSFLFLYSLLAIISTPHLLLSSCEDEVQKEVGYLMSNSWIKHTHIYTHTHHLPKHIC